MNGDALVVAPESEKGVTEEKSLNNRDFLINSGKENILSLCLAWMAEIAVARVDVAALAIDCLKKEFIGKSDGK